MNNQIQESLAASLIYLGAFCAAFAQPFPNTQPGLELELYAGLSITGAVGTVYSVEYVTDLAQTNNLALPGVPATASQPIICGPIRSAPATGSGFTGRSSLTRPRTWCSSRRARSGWAARRTKWSERDQEGPQTAVTISRGFWMGKYEVTQGEYLAVMGSNPSNFNG